MDKTALSQHKPTLEQAVKACKERTYWSQYSESPKAYSEGGQEAGEKEFNGLLNKNFALLQTGTQVDGSGSAAEKSPFGLELGSRSAGSKLLRGRPARRKPSGPFRRKCLHHFAS